MAIPTFNGSAIFGSAVVMNTGPTPPAVQENTYPQVNGKEIVNLGSRGRSTTVTGYLSGADLPTLATQTALFRTLQESVVIGPLTTTDGSYFAFTRLLQFAETGRIMTVSGGSVMRQYQAVFEHLI